MFLVIRMFIFPDTQCKVGIHIRITGRLDVICSRKNYVLDIWNAESKFSTHSFTWQKFDLWVKALKRLSNYYMINRLTIFGQGTMKRQYVMTEYKTWQHILLCNLFLNSSMVIKFSLPTEWDRKAELPAQLLLA